MRILLFTTDVPPIPGVPSSGTAVRSYGFARGFESHGCEVLVCAPKSAVLTQLERPSLDPRSEGALRALLPLAFDHRNADDLIEQHEPDAVYCGHWPAMAFSRLPKAPVIVDLAGPHLLERHFQKEPDQGFALRGKLNNLASADLFIVSGRKQFNYFSAFFARAGVKDAEAKSFFIPMALSPELPQRPVRAVKDPRFLFAGIFLPWQDPSLPLRTLVRELERRNAGELRLVGGMHPTYSVGTGIYDALFREIEASKHVSRSGLLPLEALNQEMLDADVALDLMRWNLERELAVTIRTTTYLWSGLPVIYNDYADLGALITQYRAGWTVNPEDPEALLNVVHEIFQNPSDLFERSRAAQELARNEFSWNRVTEPIVRRLRGEPLQRVSTDFVIDQPEHADFYLDDGKDAAQEFICRRAGLCTIEVKLAASQPESVAHLRLLRLSSTGDEVVGEVRAAVEKGAEEWVPVPISSGGAAGDRYRLVVSSPSRGISPCVAKVERYPLAGFEYGGVRKRGHSMNIRVQCTGSVP